MKVGTLVELKSPLLGNPVHTRGVCFHNYGTGVQFIFENGEYDGFDKDEQEFYLHPIGFVDENSDYKFTNVLQVLRDFDKGYFNFKRQDTMKIFETYETVNDMKPCMKRPIVVHALQVNEDFRVKSLEGDYAQGKPGDYLMRGVDGELYICDKTIFEKSYDFRSA